MRLHLPPRLALATSLLLTSSLSDVADAQRLDTKLEFQKRSVELIYGATRFGKHSLDELAPGGEWRLGSNNASTIVVGAPLVSGTTVVPPGSYRAKIHRGNSDDFSLMIEGAGYELSSNTSLYLPGTYADEKKSADKLDVRFSKAKDQPHHGRAGVLTVHFGPHSIAIPATLAGSTPVKLKGFEVDAFAIPCETLEARAGRSDATVVASIRKKGRPAKDAPAAFNLLISDDEAVLLPVQIAPTDSYGFGDVTPPPPAWTFRGAVEWSDSQEEFDVCKIEAMEITKEKKLRFILTCGARTATVTIDLPIKARRNAG